MKFTYTIAALAFLLPFAIAGGPAVPLYRAYSASWTDHFYTTDKAEMDRATTSLTFSAEGITGYIFPTQEPQTVPLYRSFQPTVRDHFYTINKAESDNAVAKLGYSYEGITGYVYPPTGSTCAGAAPLYRAYNPTIYDHFYTMSAPERDNAVANLGYSNEGVAAYILVY
ncbi:hypothetical protein M413DRAFT_20660 [Hebeloma cylindrosporum]|uniref:DUF5648 domain-containing protein n=1 Tax=Hebeloma cylindrosporum TaxID=76867 RepID=A0A0C2Y4Q8_HEBCY|nr:hypothetical protein M413DRAFT_20660 [Hebeloma cylindrosporum h7]